MRNLSWRSLILRAVNLAMDSTLDADEMNSAATYLLDQHRLARRLRGAPPAARDLLLRKKEQILCALLEMDADGDGEIDRYELRAGLKALGLGLSDAESDVLFDTMDADRSGAIAPDEVEVLLYGRPLEAARRAHIVATESRSTRHGGRAAKEAPKGSAAAGILRLVPLYLLGTLGGGRGGEAS